MSVERTVARLLGIDGANELEAPLANVVVDQLHERGELGRGVGWWLGNALIHEESDGGRGRDTQRIAEAVDAGELDLSGLPAAEEGAIRERIAKECEARLGEIAASDRPLAPQECADRARLAAALVDTAELDRDGSAVPGMRLCPSAPVR